MMGPLVLLEMVGCCFGFLILAQTSVLVVRADRPALVQQALANNKPIYYFGLGSNMSRKKLENRGANGTKIEILKMEPAVVPNYRLAFSLRGFPPLEPGMGSLESVGDSGHKPILAYHKAECHGALVKLTPENYEKVMRSEGVDPKKMGQKGGYDEIVVEAFPYGTFRRPVQAVALRAKPQSRLSQDACPSARYMKILREGAEELGLKPCYQQFLADHPVQKLKPWQKKQAFYNLLVVFSLSFRLKLRFLSRIQSRLLYLLYTRPGDGVLRQGFSETMTALVLLPGAILGFFIYRCLSFIGKAPPFVQRLKSLVGEDSNDSGT